MKKENFEKEGFIYNEAEEVYYLIKDNKIILQAFHMDYMQGLPMEWMVKKLVEKVNWNDYKVVYEGKIPTQQFLKDLVNNIE